jgi:hypothetical protein
VVITVPAAIAIVSAAVMAVIAPVVAAIIVTVAAAISHELDAVLALAQADDAGRRGRCGCGGTTDCRSQCQETYKYETLHPIFLLAVSNFLSQPAFAANCTAGGSSPPAAFSFYSVSNARAVHFRRIKSKKYLSVFFYLA